MSTKKPPPPLPPAPKAPPPSRPFDRGEKTYGGDFIQPIFKNPLPPPPPPKKSGK